MATTDISVVLPVYGSETAVERCLESLRSDVFWGSYPLHIVDDGSESNALTQVLQDFAGAHDSATLHRHASNRGFAAAVATGAAAAAGDFVVLNSDTAVPSNWLERLQACAASVESAATVTPFTNAGAICSYPYFCKDSPLPEGLDLAALDALCKECNARQSLEIPTGVGFCMYISRECWDQLGGFDVESFGAGYGEETDFCTRAVEAGWKNLLCADLFVYHEGGSSFGAQRQQLMERADQLMAERHPAYGEHVETFIASDPVAPLRARIDESRLSIPGQEQVLEAELNTRAALVTVRLNASQSLAVERLQSIRKLEEQALEHQRLLDDARSRFSALEDEAERRTAAYKTLETDYDAIAASLESQTAQTAATQKALAELQERYGALYEDRDAAALERDQAQALLNEYGATIKKLETALAGLETLALERQQHIEMMDAMWGVRLQRRIERLKGS